MFDIYSIGDSLFLQQVLNALAMITGTGSFMVLVKIGFMMGIIFIAMQAIVEGARGVSIQHTLIGWLLFSLFFGTTATVRINDVYTGQVRVVDNVPYGVAATGSIISMIGYHTTELFEQAFSTPTMTSDGFASALQTLAKTRQAFIDKTELGVLNSPNSFTTDDIVRSWENYIKDCTLVGVDLNQKSFTTMMSTNLPRATLRWDSGTYGTQIYLNGTVSDVTCSDAWQPLIDATNSTQWFNGVEQILRARLDNTGSLFTGAVSPTAATNMVDTALAQLGLTGASAQRYVYAAVLLPALEEATVGKDLVEQGFTHALMSRDAIERRNSEWAASQSMFFSVIRPALTFIEAFAYAIAPFIAFLVGIGMVGISAAGKYLLTLIWIQLWMPLLAIVNLFINMSVTYKMAALGSATNMVVPAYGAMYQLDGVLQNYIAFGGMLSSIVPGIALMLVYGGSWATTGLVDRMSSTSQVDATQATPKVLTQGALLASAAMYSSDPVHGARLTGADSIASRISVGSMSSTDVGDKTGIGTNTGITSSDATTVGHNMAASRSARDKVATDIANSIGHELGFSNKETEQLRGILGMGLSGGGTPNEKGQKNGKGAPVSPAAKVALESVYGNDKTNAIMEKLGDTKTTTAGKSFEAAYQEATTKDRAHGVKTAAEDYTSSDAYKSHSASSAAGISTSVDSIAFGNWASAPGTGRLSKLKGITNQLGLEPQVAAIAANEQKRLGITNKDAAIAIGAMTALANLSASGGIRGQAAHDAFIGFAQGQGGLRADKDLPLAGAYNLTPDPHLKEVNSKEMRNNAGDFRSTVQDVVDSTDPTKDASLYSRDVQGRGTAAQKQMRQEQAGALFSQLKTQVGKDPNHVGAGATQSLAKIGTQEAEAVYKTGSEALKQVFTATGQAAGAGAAGAWENGKKAFDVVMGAYKSGKTLSPILAASIVAAAGIKGGMEAAAEVVEALPKQIQSAAKDYAMKKYGLTDKQADLYAYEQANILQRVINGGNDAIGVQSEESQMYRDRVDNDKDGVLATAIVLSARTGNEQYLKEVGTYNKKAVGGD